MKKQIADNIEISLLLSKYIRGEYDDSDEKKIKEWLDESPSHHFLLREILNEKNSEARQKLLEHIDLDKEWGRFQSRIVFLRRSWTTVAKYAAVFLLPLVIGSYFLLQNLSHENLTRPVVEIAPGVKKAQLILSNGERIDLSGSGQQIKIKEEDVVVENHNQSLSYTSSVKEIKKEALVYNQLLIGRGEEYQLVLSDGTKVWLNSETKLKYPTHFASNIREVELEGEAYFEVTKNAKAPFIVKTKKMDVEVLGTKFNVSAYREEQTVKTTLLEGKVKIRTETEAVNVGNKIQAMILTPNDQATYNKSNDQLSVQIVDAPMFVSWTKGFFAFDEESLDEIMNRLTRWYDIDVIYQDNKARESKFSGKLPRFEDCNVLLEMIQKTTNIKFDIEKNKKVVISLREEI